MTYGTTLVIANTTIIIWFTSPFSFVSIFVYILNDFYFKYYIHYGENNLAILHMLTL
uniref:Uncharacterized protein n=1 Tax=Meloidogyne enterolobii TaxID=390850 RepID=A0A6V7VQP1_MELEN|nr:unnamed protein product [Meloidogyne enterolobii]